ncbi:hypothetical protein HYS93_01035 [Candidatus Daviesbacteria bacterium]|nr:hypothetical protein [Candidatus Daviesbacteria bacterium]
MKESRLYLNFFRKNFLIIFVAVLLFSAAGLFYQSSKQVNKKVSSLWQMNYQESSVSEKISLTDQAVTILRSQNLSPEINSQKKKGETTIFKPGPLAIQIETKGADLDSAKYLNGQASKYLVENYKVSKIGNDYYSEENANVYLGLLIGFITGVFIGIIIALVRSYFKNY